MSLSDAVKVVDDILTEDAVPADYTGPPPELDEKDLIKADGHLRAIARITYDRDDFLEVAEAEVARLQDAIAAVKASAAEQIAWHAAVLERFHQAVLTKVPTRLSIKLPHGTLKSRKQEPEWTWEGDGTVFRDWCLDNRPDLLAAAAPPPPRKVSVKDAKAALTLPIVDDDGKEIGAEYGKFVDGTVPPGVDVDIRDRKFTYELKPHS